jgi:hypothetical protein
VCDWLARHWRADGPPEPAVYPDAVSFLGQQRNTKGPRWYAAEGMILGYLPGTGGGCYVVPSASVLPGIVPIMTDPTNEVWP